MTAATPEIIEIIGKARAVVDHITFDECGSMVGGHWQGGNGGLLSRETLRQVEVLRHALDALGLDARPSPQRPPAREAL